MKSVKLVGLVLLIILALLALGCRSPKSTKNMGVDIRGNIVSIHRADAQSRGKGIIGSLLIEGTIEKDTKFDKASVIIKDKTRIFEQKGRSRRSVTFDYLKVGQKVQARFTGPVLESYPVQATATEIVILKQR